MDSRSAVPTRLGFDRVVSITAPDPYTVRVRLRAAFAPFVTYFCETENYPVLTRYCLPRIDAALHSALDMSNVAARKRAYAIVQRQLAADAPLVILAPRGARPTFTRVGAARFYCGFRPMPLRRG